MSKFSRANIIRAVRVLPEAVKVGISPVAEEVPDDVVAEISRIVVSRRCKGEPVNDHSAQRARRLFEAEVVIGCEHLQPWIAYAAA